jgi:hypothetical protein
MQADRLVVGAVAEPFSISNEEFWIKAPSNDRTSDNVVVTIDICPLGNIEELSPSTRKAGSATKR